MIIALLLIILNGGAAWYTWNHFQTYKFNNTLVLWHVIFWANVAMCLWNVCYLVRSIV